MLIMGQTLLLNSLLQGLVSEVVSLELTSKEVGFTELAAMAEICTLYKMRRLNRYSVDAKSYTQTSKKISNGPILHWPVTMRAATLAIDNFGQFRGYWYALIAQLNRCVQFFTRLPSSPW